MNRTNRHVVVLLTVLQKTTTKKVFQVNILHCKIRPALLFQLNLKQFLGSPYLPLSGNLLVRSCISSVSVGAGLQMLNKF